MKKYKTKDTFDYNIVSCAGTHVIDIDKKTGEKIVVVGRRYTYKQEYDKQGKRHLVVSGTEDVYQTIQSFKDDTDINKIVARYFNGDLTVLDKNKGFYADITQIPQDFNEWHNKIEEGKNIFNGLPTDLKAKFGNSLNEFITSVYNKDFEQRYNDYVLSKTGRVSNNVNNDVGSSQPDVGGSKNE